MIGAAIVEALGVAAGLVLVRRFPRVGYAKAAATVSLIIPARNEAGNLPLLLSSIPKSCEVVVVDDGSTDHTAEIAAAHGARVITATSPPAGWIGKNWACKQGVEAASGETLVFIDADTRFGEGGLERILACALKRPDDVALSVLPYQRCEELWESFSLFFHLMMAFGAAGFTRIGNPRLLGPFLVLRRELYLRAGGHETVKDQVLEHLTFASRIEQCGGRTMVLNAHGTLWTRMYPGGFREMCAGWTKSFAAGAGKTPVAVLALSSLWLSGGACACFLLFAARGWLQWAAVLGYVIFAAQVARAARQIGNYAWISFALYPVPLLFYFCLFALSLWRKRFGAKTSWRGRKV